MNTELDYDGTGTTPGGRDLRYTRDYRSSPEDKYEPQKSCFVALTNVPSDLQKVEVAISSAG